MSSRGSVESPDLGFPVEAARRLVRVALEEDLGPQHLDVTTLATIPAAQVRGAEVVARPVAIGGHPHILADRVRAGTRM